MRDCRLNGVEAVIQRQERVPSESNDNRLFLLAENGRAGLLWAGLPVLNRLPLAPLRHRPRIDPKLPAQLRGRSLRSLYCCSDGVRSRSAAVANLSHSASFQSNEWIAPSNPGIKHRQPTPWPVFCITGIGTLAVERYYIEIYIIRLIRC